MAKKIIRKTQETVDLAISYIKDIEDLQELEEKIGEKITEELLTKISQKLISMKKRKATLQRVYSQNQELELSLEQKNALQDLKELDKKFREIRSKSKKEVINVRSRKETKASKLSERKKRIISEIESINYWLTPEVKEKFSIYKTSEFYGERLNILKELETIYMNYLQTLSKYRKETSERIYHMIAVDSKIKLGTPTSKKILFAQMNTEKYSLFKEKLETLLFQQRQISHVLENIMRLKEIESVQIKELTKLELSNEELIEKRDFLEPKNDIERDFQRILRKLVTGKYVKEYKTHSIYVMPDEIKDLIQKMKDLPIYELEELTYLAEDIIKNKRKGIRKQSSEEKDWEKAFLKQIEKEFVKIRPIIYDNDEDTSAYYNILEKLLQDDRNYDYIEKLLDIEEFIRARKEFVVKEEKITKKRETKKEHILLLALDNFIKNYKLKLLDQGLDYIEPKYYKEVIKLFILKQVELLPEEQNIYFKRIEDFKDYIKNKGYQSTNQVLSDIEEIEILEDTKNQSESEKKPEYLKEETRRDLYQFLLNERIIKNQKRQYMEFIPSFFTKTFLWEGIEPFAFSIQYQNDGSRNIGIHLLDTSCLTNGNSFLKQEVEEEQAHFPQLDQRRIYPTISLESTIESNGYLGNAKISPSNIAIGTYYRKEDLEHYKIIPELKTMIEWLHLIQEKMGAETNIYQESDIQELITIYMSEMLANDFQKLNIPFIYQSSLPEKEELIQINHNKTCQDLYKIPRKTAHEIFEILDSSKVNPTYYMSEKTDNTKIELDPNTEAGVFLFNTIHQIIEKRYDPDEAQEEIKSLLRKMNNRSRYVPSCLSSKNDKKVQQMIKIYKKKVKV